MPNNSESILEKRIIGIEQEYPINYFAEPTYDERELDFLVDNVLTELKEYFKPNAKWLGWGFAGPNGFRFYNDWSHLEISTYSWRKPFDAVIANMVSEIMGFIGVAKYGNKIRKEVSLFKNNVGEFLEEKKVSYGTHGNILGKRKACRLPQFGILTKEWENFMNALEGYMVARILYTGTGGIMPTQQLPNEFLTESQRRSKFVYTISPRTTFLKKRCSLDTTLLRGLFNIRDEPHADRAKYVRYHDINLEAARCPFQQYVTDIGQRLVFSALEEEKLKNVPRISSWIEATKLSLDTDGMRWEIELKDGKRIGALDLLIDHYLPACEEVAEAGTEDDRIKFKCWENLLYGLKMDPGIFYYGIDWITKAEIIKQRMGDDVVCHECASTSCFHKAMAVTKQYELVDSSILTYMGEEMDWESWERGEKSYARSLFDPRDALKFAEQNITWENWNQLTRLVAERLSTAPEDTRGYFISEVIKKFSNVYVDWDLLFFEGNGVIRLEEPFMLSKAKFGDMWNRITSVKDLLSVVNKLYPNAVST